MIHVRENGVAPVAHTTTAAAQAGDGWGCMSEFCPRIEKRQSEMERGQGCTHSAP
jgi:hypothetical protein